MNVVLIPTYTVNTDMQFADNLYLDILEVESISVVVLLLLKQQTKFLRHYSIAEQWTGVNPKFCVNSIWGANRAKFIQGGSRGIRLLPC